MSYGTSERHATLDDQSMEEGAVYSKSYGSAEEPKIHIVARVFLYILAGLIILGGLGAIGCAIVDTYIYSDDSDLKESFWTVPALVVVNMLAAGIVLCIATARATRSTALAWAIVHWACFWAMLMILAALASSQVFVVSMIMSASSAIVQLITCFLFTFTCAVPFLKKE